MQYFHSNKSFNQYKPHQSFWQKIKTKRKKKEAAGDMIQKTLKNPFRKENTTSKKRTKLVWWFFIILIITWIILILTLPYFKIKKIIVTGNSITSATEVENYVRQFNFSRSNYFLFPDKPIAEKIKQIFLYENVVLKKVFPDTIHITVIEKPASIIYDDNTNYYLLDIDGNLIKQINGITSIPTTDTTTGTIAMQNTHLSVYTKIQHNYGDFPVIFSNKKITTKGKNLLLPKIIKTAIDWNKYLKEQEIGEVQYFSMGETDFNLKVFLDKSWYILINTELDYQVQIQNLKIILSNNKPAEYIDLRFGERVYWK